ncbi:MAG: precorrin-6y C5,15-methyltransferase (decarboxylating) subunit CbiE [Pseudomonadota bacterium]
MSLEPALKSARSNRAQNASAESGPWLHVIGLGEDGVEGLSPAARTLVMGAEVLIGGARHHELTAEAPGERLAWPTPFSAMADRLAAHRGRRVAALVSGDPLWFSAGAALARRFPTDEIAFHPNISSAQWAACRLGWPLREVEMVTVHGRPVSALTPHLYPGGKILALTHDARSPSEVARLLVEEGYGPSAITALAALGGPRESRLDGTAEAWAEADPGAPDLHVLAIDLALAPGARPQPRTALPDDAFRHDGKMTKREARALALAKLAPRPGERLWDVGCGCGSVAVEWLRSARDMAAIGFEPKPERRALAAANALALGAPQLELREGAAPDALADADLPGPDAVFLGGGLSEATIDAALAALARNPIGRGRLVAHAVTLESEALLLESQARHGGELTRIAISRAEPVGPYRGWRPLMPVTQWSLAAARSDGLAS